MNVLAKVGPEGQVMIPEELRERLGIRPGDEVVFSPLEGVLLLVPVPTRGDLAGPLKRPGLVEARDVDPPREGATVTPWETRREVSTVGSGGGSGRVTTRVGRDGRRAGAFLSACRALLERGGPIDLGPAHVPVEYVGRGPSWDRSWRGLTTRLRGMRVAQMTQEQRAAAAVYVTRPRPPVVERNGHVIATLDEQVRRTARNLYEDPQRLQKALTEYVEATRRK